MVVQVDDKFGPQSTYLRNVFNELLGGCYGNLGVLFYATIGRN